jgi:nitrite reductase/ring-hydroxylating ferredoxin subunit
VKFVVGKVEEIPPGSRKIVRVAGRSIGVFNVDGEFYAIRNRCPHQGAPLCEGKLWGVLRSDAPGSFQYDGRKEIITCVWHGWEFSLKTGQSWCDPRRLRVRSYDVSVEEPTSLAADLPHAAADSVKNPTIVTANAASRLEDHASGERAEPEAPAPGLVKGPYSVETYTVGIENGYLYLVVDVADVASNEPARR